jgi:hypothetical protein
MSVEEAWSAERRSGRTRPLRLHYDFASTLCYVAHRLMQRMQGELDELGIRLDGSPVDLSFLLDAWPFGGIQEEQTMSSIFRRWATRRERSRRVS